MGLEFHKIGDFLSEISVLNFKYLTTNLCDKKTKNQQETDVHLHSKLKLAWVWYRNIFRTRNVANISDEASSELCRKHGLHTFQYQSYRKTWHWNGITKGSKCSSKGSAMIIVTVRLFIKCPCLALSFWNVPLKLSQTLWSSNLSSHPHLSFTIFIIPKNVLKRPYTEKQLN